MRKRSHSETSSENNNISEDAEDKNVTNNTKYQLLEEEEIEDKEGNETNADKDNQLFKCTVLFNCNQIFPSYPELKKHINDYHHWKCSVCENILLSKQMLHIHLLEIHDSFFAARVKNGKENLFECFEESCKLKFLNKSQRRKHLLSLHDYPKSMSLSVCGYGHGMDIQKNNNTKTQ